jgi:cardiolipin synthase
MRKYFEAEDLQLIYSGHNYFEVLEQLIDESRQTLHLQTYILEADETGRRVMDCLKRAAARGVKVYLLVDAFGSFPFPAGVKKELLAAGIHFRLFSPLFSSESIFLWRRMHHKIVVADGKAAMIGGINIADKYNDNSKGAPWLDYAVLTKGPVCAYLDLLCEQLYKKQKSRQTSSWEKKTVISHNETAPRLVRFRRNDWIKRKNEIHSSYVESIVKAESSITIVASYFLPGKNFRKLLSKAASRGVKIKIILAGKSDISSVRLAENYLYDFYIRNNIELYEWQNSVMHGKAMIVDNTWATIGSYNLNFLSHYVSIELNADIIDPVFIRTFAAHIDEITDTCCSYIKIKKGEVSKSWLKKLKMWLAYNTYRMVMSGIITGRRHRKIKLR